MYIDSQGNIVIDTSLPKVFLMHLMASSDNSTENAFLPLYLSVSNFAPVFENGPPEPELVQFETSGSHVYQIPSSLDIEGDAITLILSGLEDWMIYDELN